MPSLTYSTDGGKETKVAPLYKAITSVGASEECDVYVPGDDKIAETHATILFDGRTFSIQAAARWNAVFVNGKRKKSARLTHRDTVLLGATKFRFLVHDEAHSEDLPPSVTGTVEQVNAYRKIYEFSERLLGNYDLDKLLSDLLDTVVEITGADKGILVICDGDEIRIAAARTSSKTSLDGAAELLSDSMIQQAIRTKKPLIVSDALNDTQWNASMSVLALKLCSVMCVPLLDRGSLLGVLYVGNDNIVNMFEGSDLELLTIFAAQASLILRNALLVNELQLDVQRLQSQLDSQRFGELIGSCPSMLQVFKRVQRVASTDIGVLITGETGTGKELIACEVHRRSERHKGPFITINCGAIPENLLESELFGHVRGAFTGATANKIGKFQAAHGGTLFLDEIGEMPLNLQVKILRAIQDRSITRVGDTRPADVDIRIIAATNKVLPDEIREGRFREDLFYRLNVVSVELPPLRDRGSDIEVLAGYFLDRYATEFERKVKGYSPNALVAIRKHRWPGNIRELQNKIKRAVILADKALIGPKDLELSANVLRTSLPLARAKDEFQRRYINMVLARNNGNRTKTARDLGVDPRTIFRHLEKEGRAEGTSDPVLPAWVEEI